MYGGQVDFRGVIFFEIPFGSTQHPTVANQGLG